MAKFNVDDILSRLGGDEAPAGAGGAGGAGAESAEPPPAAGGAGRPSGGSGRSASGLREVFSADEVAAATATRSAASAQPSDDLGQALLRAAAVSEAQLSAAENVIKQSPGARLTEVLLEQGAEEAAVQAVVAALARLPFERIDLDKGLDGGFDGVMLQRLGLEFCKQHLVLPLRTVGQRPVIGVVRPDDVFLTDEVRQRLGAPSVKSVVVTSEDVRTALEIAGHLEEGEGEDVNLTEILDQVDEGDVQVEKGQQEEVDLEKQAGESPVIRYVNYIIQTAIKEAASDIHIEPADKKVKVRFRIDGVLFEMMNPPSSMSAAITSRLKIMANLDISERRIPQDGRIRCTVAGRKLDLRMSTLPNTYGEKVVLRILDTKSINVQLEDLGFEEQMLRIWRGLIEAPHGITLVTGPTGSGKTTTLYSSLRTLDKAKLNISTVEDPVEYHLEGVTQTQTHERIGMNFAKALKALLRQDPDVIMLGEIRDMETAHTAVQAALTGHLVLSTLHTNDAPSSMTRLVNIGLEPFLVGAAINGVLAQRLVRRICQACRKLETPSEEMREYLEMQGVDASTLYAGVGCDKCRKTGYSGRVGIYELLAVDDQLRDVIARNPNVSEFRRMCIERGMVSLRADGMKKVSQGLTTAQEILRVTEAAM